MSIWITSDWHLGETRLELMQRPFTDTEDHDETIYFNYNQLVKPEDTVYVVGDVVSNSAVDKFSSLKMVSKFNGRKILIRGNHDEKFTDTDFQPYFDSIIAEGGGAVVQLGKISCWLTHYPTQSISTKFNCVGHIHSAWKLQLNMLNVSVDAHHFRPIHEDKIEFFLNAISNFYDKDVWVSDHFANSGFKGIRGKNNRYLDRLTK
jgi:calcineurin-like phosphoesterase family protein